MRYTYVFRLKCSKLPIYATLKSVSERSIVYKSDRLYKSNKENPKKKYL